MDKKQALYAAHEDKWDAYKKEQSLLRRVKKMTYLKRKLIRAKKQKDWEEEQERLRQEEIAERRKNPWKNEIATCNELLAYTRLLLPTSEEA